MKVRMKDGDRMFIIDASSMNFTNNKTNPIRVWFKRMVDQLQHNAYDEDFDWNMVKMSIIMSSDLWECISRLYAYDIYETIYTDDVQMRHKRYLADCSLPIGGRMYPVVLDGNTCDVMFTTYILDQFEPKLSGCIQNLHKVTV